MTSRGTQRVAALPWMLCFLSVALTTRARADELSEKRTFETRRMEVEALVHTANEKKSGNAGLYLRAAEAYEGAHKTYCGHASQSAQFTPSEALCHELAFNAARTFESGHRRDLAIPMYRLIVGASATNRSPLAVKAAFSLGNAYQSLAIYDDAAQWLEHAVSLDPRNELAEGSLRDAFIFRLALGQVDAAFNDFRAYKTHFHKPQFLLVAKLTFAFAAVLVERENWERARTVLAGSMTDFDRWPFDLRIQAYDLMAQALSHGPRPNVKAALQANEKVVAIWPSMPGAAEAIARAWPNEPEDRQNRRLGSVLNAVGRSMFEIADHARATDVDSLTIPMHMVPAAITIAGHVPGTVTALMERKKRAIEHVETQFKKILELRPLAPPLWVVSANVTIAAMWGDLTDGLRRNPVPLMCKRNPGSCVAYRASIESLIRSQETQRVKPAMKECVSAISKYTMQVPHGRLCEKWLATHFKSEFHVIDEFVPAFREAVTWSKLEALAAEDYPK